MAGVVVVVVTVDSADIGVPYNGYAPASERKTGDKHGRPGLYFVLLIPVFSARLPAKKVSRRPA